MLSVVYLSCHFAIATLRIPFSILRWTEACTWGWVSGCGALVFDPSQNSRSSATWHSVTRLMTPLWTPERELTASLASTALPCRQDIHLETFRSSTCLCSGSPAKSTPSVPQTHFLLVVEEPPRFLTLHSAVLINGAAMEVISNHVHAIFCPRNATLSTDHM